MSTNALPRFRATPVLLVAAAVLALPALLGAQAPAATPAPAADGIARPLPPPPRDAVPAAVQATRHRSGGFLFGRPSAYLTLRGGMTFPRASGEIYDFVDQHLTLGKGDFRSASGELDLGIPINDRFDAVLGVGYGRSTSPSEDRVYVDDNNLPIRQTTRLSRVPVSAGLRAYLVPNGREIGALAWVPPRVAPYIAASAGLMWYRFSQDGDFVDYQDLTIFTDHLTSNGVAPMGRLAAGVDISLSPRVALNAEARYAFASASMNHDFAGFKPIDLSGLQTTAGLSVRF